MIAERGLRSQQKEERRARILAAARATFRDRGFDEATTAEIARRAEVGQATLFRYVRDKHELLLMVLGDDLEAATDAGIAALRGDGPLLDRLVALYEPRFAVWASDLALARSASAQVFASHAPNDKPQFARVNAREARILAALTAALAEHDVPLRRPPELVARSLHYLYIGALRIWMNEPAPAVGPGLAALREHFAVLLDGAFPSGRDDAI